MSHNIAPRVAITGANGFLGTALVNHFAGRGWHVRALVRIPSKQQPQANVEYVAYDLSQPVADQTLKNVDYLIHAAYLRQMSKSDAAFDVNVQGAQNLLTASRSNKLKKNVFISSMSAHNGAESVYGLQKLHIEGLFSGSKDINIRPGLIIGNGGLAKDLTQFMKKRHAVPVIGGGRQPLQVVSIDNLVLTIEKALTSSLLGTFTVAHPRVYTYKDFYRKLAQYLQVRVLFVPLPYAFMLCMFKIASALHLSLSVNEDNLIGLKNLIAVDTKRDLKRLNVTLDNLEDILKSGVLE
jgi:nucleoside-diphosphate-sugar epimerase